MPPSEEKDHPYILVVDDEPLIAATVVEILKITGYRALSVEDGEAALEAVRFEEPDLVISDIVMPRMNGFELAKAIRHSYPKCKILLFSGNVATSRHLAAELGGEEFEVVSKPIHPDQLLKLVETALKK